MSAPWISVASDRVTLAVARGSAPRLLLHDVASAPAEPRGSSAAAGAWTYHQRGHGRSGWVFGGVYDFDDFAVDLLRVLAVVGEPVAVVAAGASGVVAALAACALPGAITRIDIAAGGGWGALPAERLLAPIWEPNPRWLAEPFRAEPELDDAGTSAFDPALWRGAPELLPVAALAADLAGLACPWSASVVGLHDLLLPPDRREEPPDPIAAHPGDGPHPEGATP